MNYFGNEIASEQLRRQLPGHQQGGQQSQVTSPGMINISDNSAGSAGGPLSAMSDMPMTADETLDEMMRQNAQELNRRQSMPQLQQYPGATAQNDADRRMSLLDYNTNDAFRDFDFGSMGTGNNGMNSGFEGLNMAMAMSDSSGSYSQPNMMALSDAPDFSSLSPDLMGNMMAFSNLNVGQMQQDASMSMFGSSMGHDFQQNGLDSISTNFGMGSSMGNGPQSASRATNQSASHLKSEDDRMAMDQVSYASSMPNTPKPHQFMGMGSSADSVMEDGIGGVFGFKTVSPALVREAPNLSAISRMPSMSNVTTAGAVSNMTSSAASHSLMSTGRRASAATSPSGLTPISTAPTANDLRNGVQVDIEKAVYSRSGFDMVRALWYVSTRKNPLIQLGAVDMSCAFVVCDITVNDSPIVYVSDNFQNLTGYSRHEIVGQNCRFLQAPNGKVEAGSKREFVSNDAVHKLKQKVADRREVQQSLINYRKGGKPFLNLLTMIPIPWDTEEIRYYVGFQIDLVECPEAIMHPNGVAAAMQVNYQHQSIGQWIWQPPSSTHFEAESGQTLGVDDVSTLLQQFNPRGVMSDWVKQSWDKMLLENADDLVFAMTLKGQLLYLSPSSRKVIEWDCRELHGQNISTVCHPSDIVPTMREFKDCLPGKSVNAVFRIRRKHSGYTWFECHGTQYVEQGKGRKTLILVGRRRPVFALQRHDLDAYGGIGDSEFWTKLSTSGMFLHVSSNVRSLLDLTPEALQGTSMQELMRKESRSEFGRAIEKARRGNIVTCKHEVQNKRGQVLQASTILYPGDAAERAKPSFLLAQTKLVKASSRGSSGLASVKSPGANSSAGDGTLGSQQALVRAGSNGGRKVSQPAGGELELGTQNAALSLEDNIFEELITTRCSSWHYDLRRMEKENRVMAEELAQLLSNRKKRKRRKGSGNMVRDCANCHTRNTPEWRRGPSGNRDLCNSCGLRYAKQTGRVSPRTSTRGGGGNDAGSKKSGSPLHSSPLNRENSASNGNGTGATHGHTSAYTSSLSNEVGSLSSRAPTPSNAPTPGKADGSAGGSIMDSGVVAGSAPPGASAVSPKTVTPKMLYHSFFNPPQSQPMLLGGSGAGGSGMEMTAIREERETSA